MPRGRPKGSKDSKPLTEALMIALKREAEKGTRTKKLQRIADKLVDLAIDGNMAAIKEIGDRVDGKPTQAIGGDSDKPHELVIRVIDPTQGKM